MPNENSNNSLLQTIAHMIDTIANEGTGYDPLIHVLSLLCILHILNRTQSSTAAPSLQSPSVSNTTNPLHKILADLTKSSDGGGGPSPDMLMSLLPLLNNPQIKSKLNPANLTSILGLLNNLGGGGNEKSEGNKADKTDKKEPPAAAVTSSLLENQTTSQSNDLPSFPDTKDFGRSLNWKTTFENEKEV
jgi:hypothetical protein